MATYYEASEWKLRTPKRIVPHPMTSHGTPVREIVLHHTVTPALPFVEWLRNVERMHHDGKYYDFAYNGAASVHGDTAEARGPLVQGGATGNGVDAYTLSIVAVGDFQTEGKNKATDALVAGVADLVNRWQDMGHVATDGLKMSPHREHYATSCCGTRLVRRIPDILESIIEGGDMVPLLEDWDKHFRQRANGAAADGIIQWFQGGLLTLGHYSGPVDGVMSEATRAAWLAFEVFRGYENANDRPGNSSIQAFRRMLGQVHSVAAPTIEVERTPDAVVAAVAATLQAATDASIAVRNS